MVSLIAQALEGRKLQVQACPRIAALDPLRGCQSWRPQVLPC